MKIWGEKQKRDQARRNGALKPAIRAPSWAEWTGGMHHQRRLALLEFPGLGIADTTGIERSVRAAPNLRDRHG